MAAGVGMPGPETIVKSCRVCPAFLKVSTVGCPAGSVRLFGSKRNSLAATCTPLDCWPPGPQAASSRAQSAGSRRRLIDRFKPGLLFISAPWLRLLFLILGSHRSIRKQLIHLGLRLRPRHRPLAHGRVERLVVGAGADDHR